MRREEARTPRETQPATSVGRGNERAKREQGLAPTLKAPGRPPGWLPPPHGRRRGALAPCASVFGDAGNCLAPALRASAPSARNPPQVPPDVPKLRLGEQRQVLLVQILRRVTLEGSGSLAMGTASPNACDWGRGRKNGGRTYALARSALMGRGSEAEARSPKGASPKNWRGSAMFSQFRAWRCLFRSQVLGDPPLRGLWARCSGSFDR